MTAETLLCPPYHVEQGREIRTTGPRDATNLALNPAVDPAGGAYVPTGAPAAVLLTNLVTNPSGEAFSGSPTTMWTNRVQNPSFETNSTGWTPGGAGATLARQTTGGLIGSAFMRVTNASTALWGLLGVNLTVVAGESIVLSAYVRGVAGRVVNLRARWNIATATLSPNVTMNGSWQRISWVTTVPATNTGMIPDILQAAAGTVVGDVLDVDGVMVVRGVENVPDYFDGSTPAAGDFVYAWTGTAHASSSTQTAPGPTGVGIGAFSGSNSVRWSSVAEHTRGARSFAFTKTASGSTGYIWTFAPVVIKAGQWITTRMRVKGTAGSGWQLGARTSGGGGLGNVTAVGTGDWQDAVSTAQATADGALVGSQIIYGSAVPAGATLFIDEWLMVITDDAPYAGPYFDGATPDTPTAVYDWTGVVDGSTSTLSAVPALGGGAYVTGTLGEWPRFYRLTKANTGLVAVGSPVSTYIPTAPYTLIATLRASGDTTVTVRLTPTIGSATGSTTLGTVTLQAGVATEVVLVGYAPADAPASPAVRFEEATLGAGGTLDVAGVTLVQDTYTGPAFSGGTIDSTDAHRYAWDGTPGNSTSGRYVVIVTHDPIYSYPPGTHPIQPTDPLSGNRHTRYVYTLQGKDGTPLGPLDGVVPGGTLEYQYDARLKAGGRIQIRDTGQVIDWLNTRIKVEVIIEPYTWALGVFIPTAPVEAWTDGHRGWDVELHSKLLVLDQDAVPASYALPAGTVVTTAVRALITSAGESAGAITESPKTLAAPMVWDAGTPKLSIINDLLGAAGYFVLQIDGLGQYRALPYIVPSQRPVRYEFADGESCIYVSAFGRDQDIFEIPNRIIATQQGTGDAEGLVAVADNTDPLSPFSIPNRGRVIAKTFTGVEATDQAALDMYARRNLVDASSPTSTVIIEHAPVPLAVYDAVQFINDPATLNARHVVDKTTIRLDPVLLAQSLLRQVVVYDGALTYSLPRSGAGI